MRGTWSLVVLACLTLVVTSGHAQSSDTLRARRFDGNNIGMWVWNNGWLARDPARPHGWWEDGFEWPIGSSKFALWLSSLWIGAVVEGQFRDAVPEPFTSHFLPGPIGSKGPAPPADARYRVYKITSQDRSQPGEDYLSWPVDLGAPTDSSGSPFLPGNQTLWTVFNDARPETRPGSWYPTEPLGVEVQLTVFDLEPGDVRLKDVVFVFYEVFHRAVHKLDSLYLSMYASTDLGVASDDLAGTDTTLGAGYTYNGFTRDAVYGEPPPAIGYILLESQKATLAAETKLSSTYISETPQPYLPFPGEPRHLYFLMRGLDIGGNPIIDPVTGQPTKFVLPGDPVSGTGWVDSHPGDRELWLTTGPYDLEPGESVRVAYAICMVLGNSNLDSITRLRETMQVALAAYQDLDIYTHVEAARPSSPPPESFVLYPNHPNPFRQHTRILWDQRVRGHVRVDVVDLTGRLIEVLANRVCDVGRHWVQFESDDLPQGIYFYRLQAGGSSKVGKMVVVR